MPVFAQHVAMHDTFVGLPQGRAGLPEPGAALLVQPLPGIGDMIWHLPAIQCLAARTGRPVWVLTKRRSAAQELLRTEPAVAGVIWLARNPGQHDGVLGLWRLAQTLRQGRFASAWVLHGSGRYALAAALAGIGQRYGYGGAGARWLTHPSPLTAEDCRLHPVDKAAMFFQRLGLGPIAAEPRLSVSDIARARVVARLGARRGRLVLGIGSSDPRKQWGDERFTALIGRLDPAAFRQIVVVGGPAEREMAVRIAANASRAVVNAIGWPLDDVAAVLAGADVYIGNDTGVLNMAAAVGCRALGLFGNSPPLTHSTYIHAVRPPRGCVGMGAISVDAVVSLLDHPLLAHA